MDRRRQGLEAQQQGRAERRDALENRQQLLHTAEELFRARGVETVTMTEIAKAAGVGQGTLYRHFSSKGVLLEALLSPQFEHFQQEALADFGYEEAITYPLRLVHLFLIHFAHFIEAHTAYLQELYRAYQIQDGKSFYQCAGHQWNKERVKHYLRNAIAAGVCRSDLDSDYLAEALLALIQVDLYLYQRQVLGWSEERIGVGLSLFIEGLAQPEQAERKSNAFSQS